MLKIAHRINTIDQLKQVPPEWGVEIDLRPDGDRIILHHDAFVPGVDFEEWLKYYNHSMIILNTKSEGMEEKILNLMQNYHIDNYFFLDLSLPFTIKYLNKGLKKIAVRFSEYEPIEFAMNFAGKAEWLWIDCFTKLPLDSSNYNMLKKNFKLCIVSPELQGYDITRINEFKSVLAGMTIDAVCSKRPDLW